jgi:hypothetical protein
VHFLEAKACMKNKKNLIPAESFLAKLRESKSFEVFKGRKLKKFKDSEVSNSFFACLNLFIS